MSDKGQERMKEVKDTYFNILALKKKEKRKKKASDQPLLPRKKES